MSDDDEAAVLAANKAFYDAFSTLDIRRMGRSGRARTW